MITDLLYQHISNAIKSLYGFVPTQDQLQLQRTKKEFAGHYTLVVFPLLKQAKHKPDVVAAQIGDFLVNNTQEVASYEVKGGFLNLSMASSAFVEMLNEIRSAQNFGHKAVTDDSQLIMVEYSSPNTNKPLHLGHVRNNLLGFAISNVLEANGYKVVKTNIVNDRGIHICKSMLAWLKWGNGATPESTGKKGDHLIGDFYVLLSSKLKEEIKQIAKEEGVNEDEAEKKSLLMEEARELLRKWEAGDEATHALWRQMNEWVYAGFDETYKEMGVSFDKIYYESDTYLVGKEEVLRGLREGLFEKHEDGSVWANLENEGLDQKLLIRSDGTSVYMTQDIGTAKMRFNDYSIDKMVYVVGNEQEYHFKVLSILLDRLGFEFGKDLVHFSYGMVELPNGKMKSREGTVVDADDLMAAMIEEANLLAKNAEKKSELSDEEAANVARMVGLGALKYFILKVDPRKNMTFNPEESIDFNGNTGAFIQYAYARISSLLGRAEEAGMMIPTSLDLSYSCKDKEEALIQRLSEYADAVAEAGKLYSPALVANYCYELVKEFNQFYHECSVMNEGDEAVKIFRLALCQEVAKTIYKGMSLLGIELPKRM